VQRIVFVSVLASLQANTTSLISNIA